MTDEEARSCHGGGPTYEAKDVADGRHKDDQQVDQENETASDADVNGPTEGLVGEEDLKQGPADLHGREQRRRTSVGELLQ